MRVHTALTGQGSPSLEADPGLYDASQSETGIPRVLLRAPTPGTPVYANICRYRNRLSDVSPGTGLIT